jgi:hypothetical protein
MMGLTGGVPDREFQKLHQTGFVGEVETLPLHSLFELFILRNRANARYGAYVDRGSGLAVGSSVPGERVEEGISGGVGTLRCVSYDAAD